MWTNDPYPQYCLIIPLNTASSVNLCECLEKVVNNKKTNIFNSEISSVRV